MAPEVAGSSPVGHPYIFRIGKPDWRNREVLDVGGVGILTPPTFSDHDFSTLPAVDRDHLAHDGTPLALSQARQLASRRRARADRGGNA